MAPVEDGKDGEEEEEDGEAAEAAAAAAVATGPEPKLQLKEFKQLLLALDVDIETDAEEIEALMAEHPDGLAFNDLKQIVHKQQLYKVQSGRYYVALTLEEAETMRGKENASFCAIFILKIIFLPRQARDKHRENSKQRRVFCRRLRAQTLSGPSGDEMLLSTFSLLF